MLSVRSVRAWHAHKHFPYTKAWLAGKSEF
eukprot:COSAG04_NODE_13535_length_602_cov_0.697813_1_plen_29_part_01